MCMAMHTQMHTGILTNAHMHVCAFTHICAGLCTHARICLHIHSHTHIYMHTDMCAEHTAFSKALLSELVSFCPWQWLPHVVL